MFRSAREVCCRLLHPLRTPRAFKRCSVPMLRFEHLENRQLLAVDCPVYHNADLPSDINRDGFVSPVDAVISINRMIQSSVDRNPDIGSSCANETFAYDVNNDGALSHVDSTRVINRLRLGMLSAEAEGDVVELSIGEQAAIIYDTDTGTVSIDSTADLQVIQIVSASGMLRPDVAENVDGRFDLVTANEIKKVATDGQAFQSISFGAILPPQLTSEFLTEDLHVDGLTVDGHILTTDWIHVDVVFRDLSGNRLSEVRVGDTFEVVAMVEDNHPGPIGLENSGVFSLFVDGEFDPAVADVTSDFQFAEPYTVVVSGGVSEGVIDELGATSESLTPLGRGSREFVKWKMTALAPGSLNLQLRPSDQLPFHEALVYGIDFPVEPSRIEFSIPALKIVSDVPSGDIDLVAFAQQLAASGAKMYGAAWCPHCTDQKRLFDDGARFVPFIEVTNPDRSLNEIGEQNDIGAFPTWVFADGSRHEGTLSLEQLSEFSGIPLPHGDQPHLAPLFPDSADGDVVHVKEGSPLHIPLDGYDPNGDPLTYTVHVGDESILDATLIQRHRDLRISVQDYGDMVFALFDEEAPRVTNQITSLADSGFYDGVTFHRIIDGFVIQGGDPTGTGSGGSDLPDFDDQFHVDLQHNRNGVLSMANAGDDTNNSQFFITDGPARHLDFNHSIFGQLIEGEAVRDAINSTATGPRDRPIFPVVMSKVTTEQDNENGLLRLKALGNSGATTVTVTTTDANGNQSVVSFDVVVEPDDFNSPPFLKEIPNLPIVTNGQLTFTIEAIDVEEDPVEFFGRTASADVQVNVDPTTGEVTITADDPGFTGTVELQVGVRPVGGGSAVDTQVVELQFKPLETPDFEPDMEFEFRGAYLLPLDSAFATAEISSSNRDVVDAYLVTGNPRLELTVAGFGNMVFEVFESHVPNLAQHLVSLVESGFYSDRLFYRVNEDIIQAGASDVGGMGVSDSGDQPDEFHSDLRHNQPGVLAFAKLVDDANGGHFFITNRALPEFDFHYSIVAQLIEGRDILAAIASVETGVGGRPRQPVVIESARIVRDSEHATMFAVAKADGNAIVRIEAPEQQDSLAITVHRTEINAGPYIEAIEGGRIVGPGSIQVVANDVEGDDIRYDVELRSDIDASISINREGTVSIIPPKGFVGTIELNVLVSSVGFANQVDRFDRERVVVEVTNDADGDGQFTAVDLDMICRTWSLDRISIAERLDYFDIVVGDANFDGVFNSTDLIRVFEQAEYEDAVEGNSVWTSGDFNCDGDFDSSDLVFAFTAGTYSQS